MKRVLCFGDSNTWGDVPKQPGVRYPFEVRWPGRLQMDAGSAWQIIEEGLNGRTTALENQDWPGRNGLTYLGPCLESHNPIDVVILMLGINDLNRKFVEFSSPIAIASRIRSLIQLTKSLAKTVYGKQPEILLISPQHPRLSSIFYAAFQYPELEEKAHLWEPIYRKVASEENVHFLDLGLHIQSSPLDGLHLDADQHEKIAQILFQHISAFAPISSISSND